MTFIHYFPLAYRLISLNLAFFQLPSRSISELRSAILLANSTW